MRRDWRLRGRPKDPWRRTDRREVSFLSPVRGVAFPSWRSAVESGPNSRRHALLAIVSLINNLRFSVRRQLPNALFQGGDGPARRQLKSVLNPSPARTPQPSAARSSPIVAPVSGRLHRYYRLVYSPLSCVDRPTVADHPGAPFQRDGPVRGAASYPSSKCPGS